MDIDSEKTVICIESTIEQSPLLALKKYQPLVGTSNSKVESVTEAFKVSKNWLVLDQIKSFAPPSIPDGDTITVESEHKYRALGNEKETDG